jgi:hypothetical protein
MLSFPFGCLFLLGLVLYSANYLDFHACFLCAFEINDMMIRSCIDLKSTAGSGNSGSDNENPNNSHSLAMPQEYIIQKELNSSENLHMSHIPEPKYGEKLPYFYNQGKRSAFKLYVIQYSIIYVPSCQIFVSPRRTRQ